MTGGEFEHRLLEAFAAGGESYRLAGTVHRAESDYQENLDKTFRGHRALSEAFKCCFVEATELLNTHCRPQIQGQLSEHYAIFLTRLVGAFHAVCGAERAAASGYPMPAYTVLRNVWDNNILTSAVVQKVSTFYAIEGLDPSKPFDPAEVKKLRKKEEFNVVAQMTGKASGLPQGTVDELRAWDDLFDAEVHGSRLSFAGAKDFMKGKAALPTVPTWNKDAFVIYMNRFTEVCWSIHRLLPLIQPPGITMPEEWAQRWRLVDESHELCVVALSADLGKKIGDAFKQVIHAKFAFGAQSTFPL